MLGTLSANGLSRRSSMLRPVVAVFMAAAAALPLASSARADTTYPPRPADDAPIVDEANLLSAADRTSISAAAADLRASNKVPLVVATITSLADHGAGSWTLDRYALNLFDEWGVGSQSANKGVLLVVSKGDRRARIQLGRGYDRSFDSRTIEVMDTVIVPRFKSGDMSGGIRAGVDALARVARNQAMLPLSAGASTAPPASSPSARSGSSIPISQPGASSPSGLPIILVVGVAVAGLLLVSFIIAKVSKAHAQSRSYDPASPTPGALTDTTRYGAGSSSGGGFWSGLAMGSLFSSMGSSGRSSASNADTSSSAGGMFSGSSGAGSSFGDSGSSFGGGSSDGGGASGSW